MLSHYDMAFHKRDIGFVFGVLALISAFFRLVSIMLLTGVVRINKKKIEKIKENIINKSDRK